MLEGDDVYVTLEKPASGEGYKEKGSKFLGYAYPVSSDAEVDELVQLQKKAHPKARHCCYAWQIGVEQPRFRYHDDGEPNNSAGKPIFGQIQSFGVTNVLIIVVRYFGGTKLGVGGLINAYRSAARFALEGGKLIRKTLKEELILRFDYDQMDRVMRVVKEHKLEILDQQMELDCHFTIAVQKSKTMEIINLFEQLRTIDIKRVN